MTWTLYVDITVSTSDVYSHYDDFWRSPLSVVKKSCLGKSKNVQSRKNDVQSCDLASSLSSIRKKRKQNSRRQWSCFASGHISHSLLGQKIALTSGQTFFFFPIIQPSIKSEGVSSTTNQTILHYPTHSDVKEATARENRLRRRKRAKSYQGGLHLRRRCSTR